jgi:hypothetical protein
MHRENIEKYKLRPELSKVHYSSEVVLSYEVKRSHHEGGEPPSQSLDALMPWAIQSLQS